MMKALTRRLRALLNRAEMEGELDEELRFHIEREIEQNVARGMSPEEARRAALVEFGGAERIREECRDVRGVRLIEDLLQDLRYGARGLLRQPAFTLVAVAALALGIGANTVIFSIFNAVLLRTFPFRDPGRLVALESFNPRGGEGQFGGIAPADFWDLRRESQSFEQLALYGGTGLTLRGDDGGAETLPAARVSANFFQTFGVAPRLGRDFVAEDATPAGARAAVLSHRLWQQRFGGDPSVVGRTLRTDEGAVTVVGVMPPDFKVPGYAAAWLPQSPDTAEMRVRGARYLSAVGRLAPGETRESAEAELQAVAARLEAAHPKDNKGWTVRVSTWRDYLSRNGRQALFVLMGAVGFVLLIACANVASLLLARAESRRREMAIRVALGAGRGRLLRQSLVEGLLLALVGGALGLLLAAWGLGATARLLPDFNWRFQALSNARDELGLDAAALAFTLLVSTLTGVIFGLVPALRARHLSVSDALKAEGGGTEAPRRARARAALVVAEIALAVVLLVGAGLLLQSFARLRAVDFGYDPRGLMTMSLTLPRQGPAQFVRQVLDEVGRVPGVESAAAMSFATLGGLSFPFNVEGRPLPEGDQTVNYSAVTPEYFRTLRTPLLAGRLFDERDRKEAPPVALVNEALARQYFAGTSPLGQKIVVNYMGQRQPREVVGVVGDVRQEEPRLPARPEVFVPFEQQPWFAAWLLVRTRADDPLTARADVQQAIWTVNKNLPASKAETFAEMHERQLTEPRLYALLLGLFAAVALLLTVIGIYGVVSYTVAQRAREIGIRMALGATRADVFRLVLGRGMILAAAGVLLGLAAASGMTRLMSGLLFGVGAGDPATFGGIAALLFAVALLACYVPARRATKVEPMIALRAE